MSTEYMQLYNTSLCLSLSGSETSSESFKRKTMEFPLLQMFKQAACILISAGPLSVCATLCELLMCVHVHWFILI